MLGMHAALAFGDVVLRLGRAAQRSFLQRGVHGGVPLGAQRRHIDAAAGGDGAGLGGAGGPELAGIGQQVVHGVLHAAVRFIGAVAQAHQPVARVAQVVAHFLERLGGDGGQPLVAAGLQALPHHHHQLAVEPVAHDGGGPVAVADAHGHQRRAVRQLQQRVVEEIRHVAEVGQRVLGDGAGGPGAGPRGAAFGVHALGHVLVEQARLADQVEAVVGHRHVFLDGGRVAAPFGVALAEHERVVGQVQQVGDGRAHPVDHGRHHMCPTSSGIS